MRRFSKPPDKSGNYRKWKRIINHPQPLLKRRGATYAKVSMQTYKIRAL